MLKNKIRKHVITENITTKINSKHHTGTLSTCPIACETSHIFKEYCRVRQSKLPEGSIPNLKYYDREGTLPKTKQWTNIQYTEFSEHQNPQRGSFPWFPHESHLLWTSYNFSTKGFSTFSCTFPPPPRFLNYRLSKLFFLETKVGRSWSKLKIIKRKNLSRQRSLQPHAFFVYSHN